VAATATADIVFRNRSNNPQGSALAGGLRLQASAHGGQIDRPARMAARRVHATPPRRRETEMNTTQTTTIVHILPIVRGEFLELPGLHLTKPQVRRLWGLDPTTCDALLDTLVDRGFLKQTRNGTYARVDQAH